MIAIKPGKIIDDLKEDVTKISKANAKIKE